MRKLFKYDFKSLLRPHIIMYALILTLSLMTFIFDLLSADASPYSFNIFTLFYQIFRFFSMIGSGILFAGSIVLVIIKFFKSVLKDEGYLTHTLPLTKHQILRTKLLNAFVYLLMTFGVVIIATLLQNAKNGIDFELIYDAFITSARPSERGHLYAFLGLTALTVIIVYMAYVSVVYLIFSLGYSSNKNKVTRTIAYGVVAYVLNQIIGVIIIVSMFIFAFNEVTSITQFYWIFLIVDVIYIAVFIITYIFTEKTLRLKLNLE